MSNKFITRRRFLKGALGSFLFLNGCNNRKAKKENILVDRDKTLISYFEGSPHILIKDFRKILISLIKPFGGFEKLISKGDRVLIKPNIGWARPYEQGATTNPYLVRELARLCYDFGAKAVYVMDRPVNVGSRSFLVSGFYKLRENSNVFVEIIPDSDSFYRKVYVEEALFADRLMVYSKFFDFDVKINVPVVKTHNLSKYSIALKNTMGLLGGNRGFYHKRIHEAIVDFNRAIRFDFTILDATRIIYRNGPTGVNLKDVKVKNALVAGYDPVLLDSFAIKKFFNKNPQDIKYISLSSKFGVGSSNLEGAKVVKV